MDKSLKQKMVPQAQIGATGGPYDPNSIYNTIAPNPPDSGFMGQIYPWPNDMPPLDPHMQILEMIMRAAQQTRQTMPPRR